MEKTALVLGGVLLAACGTTSPAAEEGGTGETSTGESGGGSTGSTTESGGEASSSEDTSPTGFTTQNPDDGEPQPDYWNDGACNGINMPSSPDCMDADFAGFCDDDGRVVWCENNQLFCIDCEGDGTVCEWVDEQNWFDCIEGGGGTDETGGMDETGGGTDETGGGTDSTGGGTDSTGGGTDSTGGGTDGTGGGN